MERPTFHAVIPATVRYSACSASAILLYGEISALCQKEGYCWASTGYFAGVYRASERSVFRWLAELEKAGFIKTEPAVNQHGQRRIVTFESALPEVARQNWHVKNVTHNDTRIENDTSEELPPVSPKPTKASRRGSTAANRLEEFLSDSNGCPPAEWGEWAHNNLGWDTQRVSREWDDFADYWTSGNAVGGGRKADWPATWRSHCRRSANRGGGRTAGAGPDRGLAAAVRTVVALRHGAAPAGSGVDTRQASAGSADTDRGGEIDRVPGREIPF